MNGLQQVTQHRNIRPAISLTDRELDVLDLSGKGLSMKGVALELGISVGTVRWHLRNSFRKLGASSRENALKIARSKNLISSLYVCQICACAMASPNHPPRQPSNQRLTAAKSSLNGMPFADNTLAR